MYVLAKSEIFRREVVGQEDTNILHAEGAHMQTLTFVTGNKSKFEDMQRYFKQINPMIELVMCDLHVPEIQSLDIEKVAQAKAAYAWEKLQRPLIVDDGGVFIECYNRFPGTLAKYVVKGIGLEGIWRLAEKDPRAYFLACIVYQDEPGVSHIFSGICYGKFIKPDTAIRNPEFPYQEIFVPNGAHTTYAQLREEGKVDSFSHRRMAIEKMNEFLASRK